MAPPLSPHRLFTPLRVRKGGATTLCHQAVAHGPEHVPALLPLWLPREAAGRRYVKTTGQTSDYTLLKLYLYWVGSQAVPQREDALVSDNLWETVNHSSEMDVDSAEVGQPSTLRLQKKNTSLINDKWWQLNPQQTPNIWWYLNFFWKEILFFFLFFKIRCNLKWHCGKTSQPQIKIVKS